MGIKKGKKDPNFKDSVDWLWDLKQRNEKGIKDIKNKKQDSIDRWS